MAVIKEFREWFLRNVIDNVSSKQDQETGFPVQYQVNGKLQYNRFLKNNFPSENVFKKLFESLTFKLNVEDTASTSQQGLSKLASDQNSYDRDITSNGNMSKVVEPSQLPDVTTQTITSVSITVDTNLGNPTLTGISNSDILLISIGGVLIGTGIASGAKIIGIDYSANEIELDLVCTATGTVSVSQSIQDTSLSTISFNGVNLTTFKRSTGTRFKKMFKIGIAYQNSLEVEQTTQRLQLKNDSNTPGNNKIYGTTNAGVKGWRNFIPTIATDTTVGLSTQIIATGITTNVFSESIVSVPSIYELDYFINVVDYNSTGYNFTSYIKINNVVQTHTIKVSSDLNSTGSIINISGKIILQNPTNSTTVELVIQNSSPANIEVTYTKITKTI